MEPVRVFVGTDRSQLLAVKVLEHSIKRHTTLPVVVTPMLDLPIRSPRDPRQGQRTGFSFSRYCIPALAGYQGRAIYMDADMLVFKDIRELWEMPFDGAKVIIQEDLSSEQSRSTKSGAPAKRVKQSAVMILDCSSLTWKIDEIVDGLDEGKYDYAKLMFEFCLLNESEIRYAIPFRWNSLEHFDQTTALIHYTDMSTQPWVSPFNPNAQLWYDEVNRMLANGSLTLEEIKNEISLGYFRPSLLMDLKLSEHLPRSLRNIAAKAHATFDKMVGYKKHAEVYHAKSRRDDLIRKYEEGLNRS